MSSEVAPPIPKKLKDLLPHGAQKEIAEVLGLSKQAVSEALTAQQPGHPAVVRAGQMLRELGILDAVQVINTLNAPTP